MGLFICAKCNCVENTALGHYWSKHRPEWFVWEDHNKDFKGLPLCSECRPTEFVDGSGKSKHQGKWHGGFPKQDADQWLNTEEGKHYKKIGYYLEYIDI